MLISDENMANVSVIYMSPTYKQNLTMRGSLYSIGENLSYIC